MESISRAPPQRTKHLTATNSSASSFSLRSPYDDVLLSRGGKTKLEPHDYAEIFSGSSSVPVLDLPGLNAPVRPGGFRSSEIDYSNIFGGAKGDDVEVQLVNGVDRKNRTRIPNGQSTEEIKQKFNISFNKTNQRSSNESNAETHVAKLHAVSGFTHFVDGQRHIPSTKPDVNRTWSFSSGIEDLTTKGGLRSEKSHIPVKSWNVNGVNVRDKESVGGNSPPLFDEELEENSDAALSVAALKKAIRQAQESIRLAKMIVQKKGEGVKDVSRARRSKGRSKVEDKKESRTNHNLSEEFQRLDPVLPVSDRVDGKSAPILNGSDSLLEVGKAKVETVRKDFESANDHGDAFSNVENRTSELSEVSCGRPESAPDASESMQELEESSNEATVEPCQETIISVERVLECPGSMREQEKITPEGGVNLRGKKFVWLEDLCFSEQLPVPMSELNILKNESQSLAEKNMIDQAGIDKELENVSEWKEDSQDGKHSDEDENGIGFNEETLWFESEPQLDEPMEEEIVLEPKIDDSKMKIEYEESSLTVEEYEENETEIGCTDAACEVVETNYSEVQNVEEINDTCKAEGRSEELEGPIEFHDSTSEKDTSEAFDAHSEDSRTTIFTEIPEACKVDSNNKAEKDQAVLRGCEDNYSLPRETETFLAVEANEVEKQLHLERNEMPRTNSFALMNADNEKALPKDEGTETQNTANADVHDFPVLHVSSTNDKVESFDKTNAEPDLQQNSEKSEESESSSTFDMNSSERVECLSEAKEMEKFMEAETEIKTGQNIDNLSKTSTSEQQDAKLNDQKCEIDDQKQRIEAIKRGREREKDRIAVERVIREARERAFAEARERAERAAVEKAATEARQRVMEEVKEKTKKGFVETKPSADKASKLRAERAAVERATAEARERAQKAMSQNNSRNNGLKHSFSSSDVGRFDGVNSESAQRRKAKLERHQRIMERAGKALAEKNMRDFLAQKEQAERNRLAESLDADIKRWAAGKHGNLRALLSTLQYILGSESGWQPVSLTDIVTTAAAKKAYRKATLCVHPDKLQQRGASIQQKYICEKIFDLLKAAWNRFNSEEI